MNLKDAATLNPQNFSARGIEQLMCEWREVAKETVNLEMECWCGEEIGDNSNCPKHPLAPGEQPPRNLTLLESQAQSILTNCCQLLDSVKSEWAPENCWSDWDQSVRDAASAWLKDSYHCGTCGAELGDSVKRVAPVADGSSPSKAPSPAPPVQERESDERLPLLIEPIKSAIGMCTDREDQGAIAVRLWECVKAAYEWKAALATAARQAKREATEQCAIEAGERSPEGVSSHTMLGDMWDERIRALAAQPEQHKAPHK